MTSLEILRAVTSAASRGSDAVPPILLRRKRAVTTPNHSMETFVAHLGSLGAAPFDYTDEEDNLDAMGTTLVERLVNAVQRIVGTRPEADWLQLELDHQATAAGAAVDSFVGRVDEQAALDLTWNLRPGADLEPLGDRPPEVVAKRLGVRHRQVAVVAGTSGIGKSALLSAMALTPADDIFADLGVERPVALVGVGWSPYSRQLPVALLVLIAQIDASKAEAIAALTTPATITTADVLPTWRDLLDPASKLMTAKIVVDGVDELLDGERPVRTSDWLPVRLPPMARLLLSAKDDGIELPALRRRLDVRVLELGELTTDDAVELVRSRLARSHKTTSSGLAARVASRSRTPRWLVVASQLLLTVGRHDYLLLASSDLTELEPEQALERLLHRIVAGLNPSLDDLYLEVLDRLYDCFPTAVHLAGLLSTSSFGLRDVDLIGAWSPTLAIDHADLALARSLLAELVTVVGDRWSFAHATVVDAVERLIDESSKEVGADVAQGYRNLLVRHLAGLPVDDPVREQELLPLLVASGELETVTRVLARDDLSTRRSHEFLAGMLIHVPVDVGLDLLDAALDDSARLTLAELLLVPGSTYAPENALRLYDRLEAVANAADPRTTSRWGTTAGTILAILPSLRTAADITSDVGAVGAATAAVRAMANGESRSFRSVLAPIAGPDLPPIVVALETVSILYDLALVAWSTEPSATVPDDVAVARDALSSARALSVSGMLEPEAARLLPVAADLAEAACAVAWPDQGFAVMDDLVEAVAGLVSEWPGVAVAVLQLAQACRLRALERYLVVPDDADDWTGIDADAVLEAIELLEVALWHLDAQIALTPASASLLRMRVVVGRVLLGVLNDARMHATAWSLGRLLVIDPFTSKVLDPEDFLRLGCEMLVAYSETAGAEPAHDVVRAMSEFVDQTAPAGWADGQGRVVVEGLLLAAALQSGLRFDGDREATLASLARTVELFRTGVLPRDEAAGFDELVAEQLADIAEQMADLDSEELEEPEVLAVRAYLASLEELRAPLRR